MSIQLAHRYKVLSARCLSLLRSRNMDFCCMLSCQHLHLSVFVTIQQTKTNYHIQCKPQNLLMSYDIIYFKVHNNASLILQVSVKHRQVFLKCSLDSTMASSLGPLFWECPYLGPLPYTYKLNQISIFGQCVILQEMMPEEKSVRRCQGKSRPTMESNTRVCHLLFYQ